MEYPFDNILEDYPLIFKNKIVYLDSATKTLPPISLIEKIKQYYIECGISPRRGAHQLAAYAERELENSRLTVAKLVNATKDNIIFTPSIPISAATLISGYPWMRGDKLLVSSMEHNSILAPAIQAKKRFGLNLTVIKMNQDLKFDIEDFKNRINSECKILLVTLTPMILGVKNPLNDIAKIAHEHNCYVISDVTRSIIHQEINFNKLECDAILFSGCIGIPGLEGTSIICAKKDFLEILEPLTPGSGSVKEVSYEDYKHSPLPDKLEAGLINMASIISVREAINYLTTIGLEKIRAYTLNLTNMIYEKLNNMDKIKLYVPKSRGLEAPIISFNIEGFNSHDTSIFLDEMGKIITRSGMQCTYPLSSTLNEKGVVQISPHFYNTHEHVSILTDTLNLIIRELS
ncbi:MAG: aminotransferase class V-fold PLP-dependent enzyme [Candidatus Odinarchaeota archaeon]